MSAPACPRCGSMEVVATQAEAGEWTDMRCKACGHEWQRRRGLRCPVCGATMRPVYGPGREARSHECPRCGAELRVREAR